MPVLLDGTPSDIDAPLIPLPAPPTAEALQMLDVASFRLPGDADDSPAFVRLFDEIDARLLAGEQVRLVDLRGYHELSEPMEIRGDGLRFLGPATFVAMEPMSHVLGITSRNSVFSGPIFIKGGPSASGQSFAGRRATVGILMRQTHSTMFDYIRVDGVKRDGVLCEALPTNFTMLTQIRLLKTNHCGSAAGGGVALAEVSFDFTGRTDTTGATGGGSNSVGQRSALECVPPDDLEPFDIITYQGEFYFVQEIDRDSPQQTVSVFPWLPIGANAGTAVCAFGAGLRTLGGNAGGISVRIDGTLCGAVLAICSLYGPQIQLQGHACAMGAQIGYKPGDGPNGFGIHGFYTEADILVGAPFVKVARECSGEIDGAQSLFLPDVVSLTPRATASGPNPEGLLSDLYQGLSKIRLLVQGEEIYQRKLTRPGQSTTVLCSNSSRHVVIHKNNPNIRLSWNAYADRLGNAVSLDVECWGSGGTGPISVTFSIDASDPGGTVQGGATLVLNPAGPAFYRLTRITPSSNWHVREILSGPV